MDQVFASWSGGKESCLACYRAIADGLKVCYLVNMVTEDGTRSRTHGLPASVIQMQSQAIGIPLIQRPTTWGTYETEFKNMLRSFKREGIEGGVFGDIDLEEHREWIERVCREVGITAYSPLWGKSQDEVLRDLVNSGFEAIVVATKANILGKEWLGQKIDLDFINRLNELSKTKDITLCGEVGEYHTLVIDGPLFKKRLEVLKSKKTFRDEHWFLEILDTELRVK